MAIGRIPYGWRVKKLSECGKIITGKTPSTTIDEYWNSNDISFIKPDDFTNNSIIKFEKGKSFISYSGFKKTPTIPPYSVLITCIGKIGKVLINQNEATSNQQINSIIPNEDIHYKFLAYSILKIKPIMLQKAHTSIVSIINKTDFEKFEIPVPPLPQQKKIAKVLDNSSSLVEKQKELLKQYDLFLKSKFIEMFGNLKNNPHNFKVEPLSQFGEIITGNTPPRKELENYNDDYIEWIKTDNISTNRLYVSKAKEYLSKSGMSKARVLKENGILVTCIAGSIKSIGNIAMSDRKITFNQQINAIQTNKDVSPLYLYWLIKLNKNYIQTFATSSMKKMISKGVFQNIHFIKAPIDLQNEFSKIASRIEIIKEKESQKLKYYEILHKSLMEKAFKGEIK